MLGDQLSVWNGFYACTTLGIALMHRYLVMPVLIIPERVQDLGWETFMKEVSERI